MALKLSNNANGILATAISNSATSLTLRSGHGSRFPALSSGDWFPITVVRASDPSQREIMRCIGRNGDTLTVERAQEGTSAIAFSAGDVVELRLTAGTLEENFPQVAGRAAKQLRFSVSSDSMGRPELEFANASNTAKALANKGRLGTTNLDLATDTGLYTQTTNANALPDLNYPIDRAGALLSFRDAVGVQLYLAYNREAFLRGSGGGEFGPWRRFAFADEIGELKGKRILFLEATAPPGWTQDTSINDRVLRVVSGPGGGSGGSWTISGLSASVSVGATTLSVSQMPVHEHPMNANEGYAGGYDRFSLRTGNHNAVTRYTQPAGGGGSHTHSASASISSNGSWRPAYVDVIACTKD